MEEGEARIHRVKAEAWEEAAALVLAANVSAPNAVTKSPTTGEGLVLRPYARNVVRI
ncbi:MAG: hypothetical protein PVG99_00540 [Desulfobacteraceae bacterium]